MRSWPSTRHPFWRRRLRRNDGGFSADTNGDWAATAVSTASAHPDEFVGVTVTVARKVLRHKLENAGIESASADARILLGHTLDLDHRALIAQGEHVLDAEQARMVTRLTLRRLAREPIARILGEKEFWGLTLRLNAHAFVPRPDTETVVEAALAALDPNARAKPLRIADLGTGSGALLLALLSELPEASGIGTDMDVCALECARTNALAQGARASFIACDYASALNADFDLVVSNPPYIQTGEIVGLAPEVRQFDPKAALNGGPDGLDGYRAVAADAVRLLRPDGVLVVELGCNQALAVVSIFEEVGLAAEEPRYDLSGIPRALPARLRRDFGG
jgi:release factor glutamine methyltransferase